MGGLNKAKISQVTLQPALLQPNHDSHMSHATLIQKLRVRVGVSVSLQRNSFATKELLPLHGQPFQLRVAFDAFDVCSARCKDEMIDSYSFLMNHFKHCLHGAGGKS